MEYYKFIGFLLVFIVLAPPFASAESSIIYHYDLSNRLEYTINSSNNATYYLYDRNGNLKRKVPSSGYPVFTSSSIEGWETYKLSDNNPGTLWSSKNKGTDSEAEWVAVDIGKSSIVSGVQLTPRGKLAFPVNFKIQSSEDAETWADIPGQSYSNYINDGSVHNFEFDSLVVGRYIRVYATKLGKDDGGGYYFQLADVKVQVSAAAASSTTNGWPASRLVDQNPSTVWSSLARYPAASTEWVVVDAGTTQMIGGIQITPRGNLGFPVDFTIQSSNDAKSWTDIEGQSYSGYTNNGSVKTFTFKAPVFARYIRVYATKLGTDDNGGYYFQLNEFRIIK
ncbi:MULTISPECIES: discoidin domain-containing protein [unclassified Paenibacillus]|uniref:discoidin domain-containing protein n=1 Tax=unclassified Paenibacillus TaxID=185978 RepID=UPI002406FFCA|nr:MULTISPECIES: discoidin domain-containing protein [unclassified Paenibacillus]MDF9845251.1 hypothetical protein [Paenibacillus sp. PastF-2]MDF9851833.1 hypothetical protein [Paenibacillus sp. PastM-2]MDF9858402.1 hypothetical protein [Paenibacillus sp. PastF-1]MDH6483554.1 hypothetical protein [Paenibacillus sp. PastH-2]MDH6511066.1 hypothetical protein [Paenibacillus sp. PastM-3]